MNNLFGNWFNFTSKEQRQRKEKVVRKKAYPLGEEEVVFEDKAIRELFKDDHKVDLDMIKYVAVALREMKYNSTLDEDDENYESYEKAFALFKETIKNIGVTDGQLEKIYRLNEVIINAKKIEDLRL